MDYGFIVTMVFIICVIPTISYFAGKLGSLAIEFGGASMTLLVALFVQLFHASSQSKEILFLLLLVTILHGAGVPLVIVMAKVPRNDKSFFFAFSAFPFSLLISQALLFITASITLNADNLIKLRLSEGEKADVVFKVLLENDAGYIFYVLIGMLVFMSLLRFFFFTKEWKSNHPNAASAVDGMPATREQAAGDS